MHTVHPDLQEKGVGISIPTWKYASSVYLPKYHCVIYRDDALGIQKQVMTRRWTFYFPAKQKEYFFIDGDKRTFRSMERLMAALRSRRGNTRKY